jgi:adenylyltransferase/sulfurtransferase
VIGEPSGATASRLRGGCAAEDAGVLVVGAGGLGCPALYALAARGVPVTVVDDDVVDVSNLQRQILHRAADVGRPKVESARDALLRRWPALEVTALALRVEAGNVDDLLSARGFAAVLDGTDSFESKFLLNDACVRAGAPLVHGGVVGWIGQLMSVVPGHACYRCLFEAPPPPGHAPSCRDAGVLGAAAGVIGGRMAEEAIAIRDGAPRLAGALETFDARTGQRRRIAIRPRPGCAACGERAA